MVIECIFVYFMRDKYEREMIVERETKSPWLSPT